MLDRRILRSAIPISFPSLRQRTAVLRNLAVDGILAVGMMMLMIRGVFDLSVGSMISLVGRRGACLLMDPRLRLAASWPSVGGLAVASLAGCSTACSWPRCSVNALITTLGTLGIFQGVAILVGGPASPAPTGSGTGDARPIGGCTGCRDLAGDGSQIFRAENWGLVMLVARGGVVHYLLAHTRFFRQYYYVGSNAKAAGLSGIAVERMQILAFTLMGLIAGLAGLAFAAGIGNAVATAGVGAELRAITAVDPRAARASPAARDDLGAIVGVVFMALINNVLIIRRVSPTGRASSLAAVLVRRSPSTRCCNAKISVRTHES